VVYYFHPGVFTAVCGLNWAPDFGMAKGMIWNWNRDGMGILNISVECFISAPLLTLCGIILSGLDG